MTLALRLLRGYVGVSSPPIVPFSITTNGFWNNIAEPRAAYYNGKTYLAWIDDAGDVKVASYTHAGGAVSAPFTIATGLSSPSGDIHNSVAILVRSSDHKILVAYCFEGDSHIHFRLSTSAEDVTAFGSAYTGLSSGNYTYIALFQMNSGDLYLTTRSIVSGVFYLGISGSADAGATWDAGTRLITPVTGSGNPDAANYWRVGSDGTNIHFLVTDTSRVTAHPSSVYHMYLTPGGALHKSDGTSLGSTFPVLVTLGTLVQNASLGSAWSEGVSFIGGNPATVLLIYDSANTKNLIKGARWNGSAWVVTSIADSVSVIGGNKFIAGAAIDKGNPSLVWANRETLGKFELFRYISADGGATWTGTQVTSASASDNAMPDTPANAVAALQVVWGLGTYTSDSDFDFTVYGAGT